MAARCRAFDWSATPLGEVERWPASLRAVVRACMESPFAIALFCGPELVVVHNDACRCFLGDDYPEALGRPAASIWAEAWPEVGPIFDGIRAGGPPFHAEDVRLGARRRATGGTDQPDAWFTMGLSAVRDEMGRVVALLGIALETTGRMEAERDADRVVRALELERSLLEYVFRRSPAFLAVLRGPTLVFEQVNDAYYQLVGHRSLVGRPIAEALPEAREQGFRAILDQVLETGEPFFGRELPLWIQRTPGAQPEELFVDFAYLPLVEADGTRAGIIACGTDVTEQVRVRREAERLLGESERARAEAERARAEAERARADADSANRTKSEFLATMSHEFRTPLNAIMGYAQLLDMGVLGPATPAQRAHLERLQASARHLLRLVDDVLDVAKVDADRLEVRRDTLVTGTAVVSALALIQPQATAKGIRVLDLGAGAPGVRYYGDEHRVRQILVNLLSNAVKFTPPGGEITVTCGETAEPAPGTRLHRTAPHHGDTVAGVGTGAIEDRLWAFVQVEDTGPGLAPELVGRLFEPFVQGDSAFTRVQGGTGLGLAISRRLARLMGGDLTVRSHAGTGAVFTLWLPGVPHPVAEAGADQPDGESARRPSERHPATGADGAVSPGGSALDDASFAVLHALGVRLAADAETIAERYVAALRADGRFPGARDLPTVQLRDHATPAVSLLATQLMVIGETRGQAPELLGDGGQVQRLMDELHGAQRLRLGWSEADIEREVVLLQAEVERGLRAAVDLTATAVAGGAGADPVAGSDISMETVRAATRYASDVTNHMLDWGKRTTLRSYRYAKSAEAR